MKPVRCRSVTWALVHLMTIQPLAPVLRTGRWPFWEMISMLTSWNPCCSTVAPGQRGSAAPCAHGYGWCEANASRGACVAAEQPSGATEGKELLWWVNSHCGTTWVKITLSDYWPSKCRLVLALPGMHQNPLLPVWILSESQCMIRGVIGITGITRIMLLEMPEVVSTLICKKSPACATNKSLDFVIHFINLFGQMVWCWRNTTFLGAGAPRRKLFSSSPAGSRCFVSA